MATGILGTIAAAGSLTYVAPMAAKLMVSSASSSGTSATTSINGTIALALLTAAPNGTIQLYVGAGQSVTITNSSSVTSVVSVLEEF